MRPWAAFPARRGGTTFSPRSSVPGAGVAYVPSPVTNLLDRTRCGEDELAEGVDV